MTPQSGSIQIRATQRADLPVIRTLFLEFADSLDFELCFQNFDQELANLPGRYARPSGNIFLAIEDGVPAGCVAMRRIGETSGELKRLWVRPPFRNRGIGRRLTQQVIDAAKHLKYDCLRLDTIDTMTNAILLYRSLGFRECQPYTVNPIPGAVFMELRLGR